MQSYAAEWKSGYGFLITDLHLVVLRLSLEITSDGLATSRLRRPPSQPPHKRIASDSTDASSQLSAMSIDTSMYSDNVRNLRCPRPDYVAAPWSASGKRCLTVKLALGFYFPHGREGKGPCQLYLSSSRQLDAAHDGTFQHNTSRATASKLPRSEKLRNLETIKNSLPRNLDCSSRITRRRELQVGDGEARPSTTNPTNPRSISST